MMNTRKKQKGVVLIIGMIMLVLITLLVVTAFNMSSSHLGVVNNVQVQEEVLSAANAAIERTISDAVFISTANYSATQTVSLFEAAASGTTEQKTPVSVSVSSSCEKAKTLPNRDASSISWDCVADLDPGGTCIGDCSGANESLCADSLWDVQAVAQSPMGVGTALEVHEGVTVTSEKTKIPTGCGS